MADMDKCPECTWRDYVVAVQCPACRAKCERIVAAFTKRPESDDHPGGPLSRAERILISHLSRRVFAARDEIEKMAGLLGAIPGNQKIEASRKASLDALGDLLHALKNRKQGTGRGE